jgi:alpha-tubulin suppressor-like RCC1 family protein
MARAMARAADRGVFLGCMLSISYAAQASERLATQGVLDQPDRHPLHAAASSEVAIKGHDVVVAGGHHVCVNRQGGTYVECWGANSQGQLGIGNETVAQALTPIPVDMGGTVALMALGKYYSCATLTTGPLLCWGTNQNGQLGDGTTESRWSPTPVNLRKEKVKLLDVGVDHTCVALVSGSLKCWGRGYEGQLGIKAFAGKDPDNLAFNAAPANNALVPQNVKGIDGVVTALAVGAFHTCVALSMGNVQCFGQNRYAQLGAGSEDMLSYVPLDVDLGPPILSLKAGKYTTCASLVNGALKCWGQQFWDFDPRVGSNMDSDLSSRLMANVPGNVTVVGHVKQLEMGGYHACILTDQTTQLQCFGFNNCGQLGDGTVKDKPKPVPISSFEKVVQFGLAAEASLAITRQGKLYFWGDNENGLLGTGVQGDHVLYNEAGAGGVRVPKEAGVWDGDQPKVLMMFNKPNNASSANGSHVAEE